MLDSLCYHEQYQSMIVSPFTAFTCIIKLCVNERYVTSYGFEFLNNHVNLYKKKTVM